MKRGDYTLRNGATTHSRNVQDGDPERVRDAERVRAALIKTFKLSPQEFSAPIAARLYL